MGRGDSGEWQSKIPIFRLKDSDYCGKWNP